MDNKIVNVCFSSTDCDVLKRYLHNYFETRSEDPFWIEIEKLSLEEKLGKLKEIVAKREELGIGEFRHLEFDLNVGNISGNFRECRLEVEKMGYEPFEVELKEIEDILDKKIQWLNEVKDFARNGYTIRIWIRGENFSECGLAFLVNELKDINADIEIAEIQVEDWRKTELLDLMKADFTTKKITNKEKDEFIKTWEEIKSKDTGLRFLMNGKIVNVPITYYDEKILKFVGERKRKVRSRVVEGHILENSKQHIQCYFINNRIDVLIEEGKLEFKGMVGGSPYTPDKYITLKKD